MVLKMCFWAWAQAVAEQNYFLVQPMVASEKAILNLGSLSKQILLVPACLMPMEMEIWIFTLPWVVLSFHGQMINTSTGSTSTMVPVYLLNLPQTYPISLQALVVFHRQTTMEMGI